MDLVTKAESLLLHQFAQSRKLNGLVKTLVKPFQEALTHIERLYNCRYIDEACGESLDFIGEIVNFSRKELSDEEYRVWLKVAILLNQSAGTANGIFAILKVLFGDKPKVQVDEYGPNVVMFTLFDYQHVPINILFSIIRHALPITSVGIFVDASPGPAASGAAVGLRRDNTMPPFQLDVTRFDESAFADFFREE